MVFVPPATAKVCQQFSKRNYRLASDNSASGSADHQCGELLIADCRLLIVDFRFFSRSHTASVSPNHQSPIINPEERARPGTGCD
jgi:hypothetical protein